MRVRTLGWAGLQIDAGDARLVIDPFFDPGPFEAFMNGPSPELLMPEGPVDAALLTHLHRDHADAPTLKAVLRPEAPVLCPPEASGPGHESVIAPEEELAEAGLNLRRVEEGETTTVGPFEVTAVYAVDGLGDNQVSWVVATEDARIFHGGDTVWHGAWWRIAKAHGPFDVAFLPANGARIKFPWIEPPVEVPAALTPELAVDAARGLGAKELVAIHHGVLEHERYYRPLPGIPEAILTAARPHGLKAHAAVAGEELEL
jgi:L-ascorbate metabolism protein UlaG (beta-lactamase superfamily)